LPDKRTCQCFIRRDLYDTDGDLRLWFADTANGIENLYSRVFKVERLCLGEMCINEDQLTSLLSGQSAAAGTGTSADAPGEQEAPARSASAREEGSTDTTTSTTPSSEEEAAHAPALGEGGVASAEVSEDPI
jgi:hypothetical protein